MTKALILLSERRKCTCTTRIGNPKTFYSFSNHGDDGEWSVGVGINALNWLGLDMYYSSNLGFGGNMQLTPFYTFGGEISYKEGISLSIGVINGDTTHEINFNIGWGTIISAAAIAVAVTLPVPGARIAALAAICALIFLKGLVRTEDSYA